MYAFVVLGFVFLHTGTRDWWSNTGAKFAHLLCANCPLRKSAENGNRLEVAACLSRPRFGKELASAPQWFCRLWQGRSPFFPHH